MSRIRPALALLTLLAVTSLGVPQEKKKPPSEPALMVAMGVVDKADKESLVVKPRGPEGKFQKAVPLKLTGTSRVSILAPQKRGAEVVLAQRDAEAAELSAGQAVAVIYADAGDDGPVVLSAVAQPHAK
jgi:hypothetical protein